MNKKLIALFHTLKDYKGENTFINGVKMLQFCKLKFFIENSHKNMKIQQ